MSLLRPSTKFFLFWLTLLIGLVIGSFYSFPLIILYFLLVAWIIVSLSGHDERTQLTSLSLTGFFAGLTLYQLTGGEPWLPTDWLTPVSQLLNSTRDELINRIYYVLPEPHGSLLIGILFGNRIKLDQSLLNEFRTAGLSHLVAASGYNLSVLVAYADTLARPLVGRRSFFIGLAIIVVFVFLSGAPASVLRAAVMAAVLLLARYLGRPSRSVNTLLFTAGVLTLFEPKIIFSIGFQLSFLATYGLLRFEPLIARMLVWLKPKELKEIIAQTLAATILTAPILIINFNQLAVIGPLTNVLVLPLIPLLMAIGVIGSLLILILPPLGKLTLMLSWPVATWIVFVAHRASQLELASVNLSWPAWIGWLFILLLVAGCELAHRKIELKESPIAKELRFA